MKYPFPEFNDEQWLFLATFEAFNQAVHISLVGELVPLTPGPFMEIIRGAVEWEWLEQTGPDAYRISPNLPDPVRMKLADINNPERLTRLMQSLDRLDLKDRLAPQSLSHLMNLTGDHYKSAVLENDLAQAALKREEFETALNHLERVVSLLTPLQRQRNSETLLISTVLTLSDLQLRLGQRLSQVPKLLTQAKMAAEHLGDLRSRALINLHLGRFSYVTDNLSGALATLASGLDEVDELGDEDIIARTTEFAGMYYFLQGMYKDAIKYLDRALLSSDERQNGLVNFFLPYTFGYCAAFLGQFNRAVGVLDYNRRRYVRNSDPGLAAYFQSALGIVMLMMGETQRAHTHLNQARDAGRMLKNHPSLLAARIGLAFYHYLQRDLNQAARIMTESIFEAAQANYEVRNYIFPFLLDLFFELHRAGLQPIANGYDFDRDIRKTLDGPNIHLRGVAHRIQAMRAINNHEDPDRIRADLESSERYLKHSGDPIELAKTRVHAARLLANAGEHFGATQKAQKAWRVLSIYNSAYFPDELKPLLHTGNKKNQGSHSQPAIAERFMEMLEELIPCTNLDELLNRVVVISSKFYQAERGGMFWFQDTSSDGGPKLRAAYNLSIEETMAEEFHPNLDIVFKAFKKNQPMVAKNVSGVRAVLCLPFEIRSRVQGVLYHDTTYTPECFDLLDKETLGRVTRHMSSYIERIWDYSRLVEKKALRFSGQAVQSDNRDRSGIIAESRIMAKLLKQADQAADSDASILILGETGVGKELLARRIHHVSPRSQCPFIVVDLTAVPDGLVESELYGHEKGAFTGAHQQKPGRLEMAHRGTLFIDEAGEIPLSMQAKLLRTLEEKSYRRIGGTRTQFSDFRLLAATNRDLKMEVDQGRFREDLYYRLNVVPLHIPPLRERGKDIILIAKHFLNYYSRKHHRPGLSLPRDEQVKLLDYHWPGNVRELQNAIEQAVLMATSDMVELRAFSKPEAGLDHPFLDLPTMDDLQRRYIQFVLDSTKGQIAGPDGAANLLGMKRSTLYSRMKKLGIISLVPTRF